MRLTEQITTIFNNILLILLGGIFLWQLYIIFIKYEEKFENPIKTTKQDYGNDFISQYGNRYGDIKKIFTTPVRLTYFGESNESFSSGYMHYFLTQYFLAPNLILRDSVGTDTIIYNLYNSTKIDLVSNFHLNNGWHIVKDFDNGLIILAK